MNELSFLSGDLDNNSKKVVVKQRKSETSEVANKDAGNTYNERRPGIVWQREHANMQTCKQHIKHKKPPPHKPTYKCVRAQAHNYFCL